MKHKTLRDEIEATIHTVANGQSLFSVKDIQNHLVQTVSRQYITRILKGLVDTDVLARTGSARLTQYQLTKLTSSNIIFDKSYALAGLKDYIALEELFAEAPSILRLSEDIRSILSYAVTEMMNNAIDHSRSELASVSVQLSETIVRFIIRDFGIGVFRNILEKYRLGNEFEAMEELLKGKTTTAPQAHSGEGIFFTSKIADTFRLRSYGYELLIDSKSDDIFAGRIDPEIKGTEVMFQISVTSKKHLNDIFMEYTNPTDLSFNKTHAYIKLFTTGTIYVSRSQAKRLLAGLDARKFKEILLDFNGVPNIGQAFADEIFRVFGNQHPDIKLTPVNTNDAVNFMIKRVDANTQ